MMVKPETKFWHELKRNTPQITWTRLENNSVFGTPDLLGYNTNQHFFTVELKVTNRQRIRFSPHQIAFHKLHPKNSFILAKHLASSRVKLYEGEKIMELAACGLELEACRLWLVPGIRRLGACTCWPLIFIRGPNLAQALLMIFNSRPIVVSWPGDAWLTSIVNFFIYPFSVNAGP